MARSLLLLWGMLSLSLAAKTKPGSDDPKEWPYASFQTGDWKPPHLTLRTSGDVDPGKIFISVRENIQEANTAPTIYDGDGNMVWQGPHRKTMDFKMQKVFGEDVITYWDGETGVIGYGYGRVHILDNTYKEIYTVTLEDEILTPFGKARDSYIDVHEHYITPDNTILVSAINISQTDLSDFDRGKPDMWVIEPMFYEIDIPTNKILFKWNALDHIPLHKTRVGFMDGHTRQRPWDAFHMNSITHTNGGYLISLRHFSSVFYLNKDGSVRWQLSGVDGGDFVKSDEFHFQWQHDARVHNETDDSLVLTLMNNNALSRHDHGPSSGVAIHVDIANRKASSMYDLKDPDDRIVTGTQGSFQLLSYSKTGHMLLGYGSEPKFKEFDGDGNVVLRGQYGGKVHSQAYRVLKYDWHATPHWDPKLVVNHTTVYTTDVYMSWLGATDYDNWAIYSVPSSDSKLKEGTVISTHKRQGFETHIAFEGTDAPYIIAVARQGDKNLRSSSAVQFLP